MDLKTYCINSGPGTAASLARQINVSPVLISQWSGVRPVPPVRAVAIERATGGAVTRRDLRPDDWQKIWPELADAPADDAQPATASEVR
ncbi:transcriptional regulator [Pseudothauera rhizosphaerae]|uniref:Helix-turn-helix domain-containing protein n=1 Tax=Pseudothauera rhizosphaerae TaxID=2565932 RepID=A0A4S4AWC8_9RHOO|nr:Cro/CI family transcriptional regulator [Pseudothauera rhizosphaerae]THF64344.1 helix-turn-helix domain-containing protein [Pseudothauera rhizosphaerae]